MLNQPLAFRPQYECRFRTHRNCFIPSKTHIFHLKPPISNKSCFLFSPQLPNQLDILNNFLQISTFANEELVTPMPNNEAFFFLLPNAYFWESHIVAPFSLVKLERKSTSWICLVVSCGCGGVEAVFFWGWGVFGGWPHTPFLCTADTRPSVAAVMTPCFWIDPPRGNQQQSLDFAPGGKTQARRTGAWVFFFLQKVFFFFFFHVALVRL